MQYEDSDAIGSIRASAAERQRLAAASRSFNLKNAIYRDLFGSSGTPSSGGGGAVAAAAAPEAASASTCRFCFSTEGELISPCMCKGSNGACGALRCSCAPAPAHRARPSFPRAEWVHLECLRAWQRSVVLTQPTHPKYQTNVDAVCNVCLEPFTGAGAPRSRHEQVLEYLGGAGASKRGGTVRLPGTHRLSPPPLPLLPQRSRASSPPATSS